ncbi:MAG: UbiA family prenyltransferase [Alphaproteobacteria bacterium]|nr:UbiA family prenyltransferase [Alphaproteobacteria bacterium]
MWKVFLKVFRGVNLILLLFIISITCFFIQLKLGLYNLNLPFWIVLATTSIAAAGYLINNYFDLNIDRINKPHQIQYLEKWSKFKIFIWYAVLNCIGIFASLKLYFLTTEANLFYFNVAIVILLFFYSYYFKKTCLLGNLMIALFSSYTYFFIYLVYKNQMVNLNQLDWLLIHYIFIFYIVFAFFVSFIRELIKDIQDVAGDALGGCKTLPLMFGISKAMRFLKIVLIATIILLIIFGLLLYLIQPHILFIIFLILIGYKLFFLLTSSKNHNFENYIIKASFNLKIIFLIGALSIICFYDIF